MKVTSAWKPLKRSRPSVKHGTNFQSQNLFTYWNPNNDNRQKYGGRLTACVAGCSRRNIERWEVFVVMCCCLSVDSTASYRSAASSTSLNQCKLTRRTAVIRISSTVAQHCSSSSSSSRASATITSACVDSRMEVTVLWCLGDRL